MTSEQLNNLKEEIIFMMKLCERDLNDDKDRTGNSFLRGRISAFKWTLEEIERIMLRS